MFVRVGECIQNGILNYPDQGEIIMFVLWPNVVTYICAALVGATIGFIIYGLIKGFENTFPND
jgi:hypothetical protein